MSTRHRAFEFSAYKTLRQHRTIPALRLKHRSGSCGTASALPKCSIMSGCGTRHRASGAKAPRTLRPLPLLRFAVSATGGAHLCSIQYYLRFCLGICRTSLAVSALRIMLYCLKSFFHFLLQHPIQKLRLRPLLCALQREIHKKFRQHLFLIAPIICYTIIILRLS